MRRWWLGFLLLGAGLVECCVALPVSPARALTYQVISLFPVVAITAGVLLHRPARRLPWLLMAAGELCSSIGDAVYSWYEQVLHTTPYPSLADVFYLAAFPFLAAGILTLTGRRRGDSTTRIDVGIVVVALALPIWVFCVEPVVEDVTASLLHRTLDLSYVVMDLLLISLIVRFAALVQGLNRAMRFLALGTAALPVADVSFAVFGNTGEIRALNTVCWLAAYVLWGTAALHPTMRTVLEPERPASPTGWRRLGVLVLALLSVPTVLVLEALGVTGQHRWDVALAAVAVVFLGVARTRLAVKDAERFARDSERLRAEVDHHAAHDPLTLLPNRATTLDLLRQSQERAARGHTGLGVLVVDVDHLAAVNDSFGERAGDDVLRGVAAELGRAVRAGDRVGRLGADEFVVVVEDVDDQTTLARIAERLTRMEVPLPDRRLPLTCCVGIAVAAQGREVGPTELLHEALTAAARAKSVGVGNTWFFDDELRAELTAQNDLEAAMREALLRSEFELHYQPVVRLDTERITSFEALIRWNRPGHGTVRPDLFIPAAERSDLICDIGRWVLAEATRQLVVWRADGTVGAGVRVAVNLSGRHLAQPSVVADVVEALATAGLPPQALVVEATETVVMDAETVLANLRSLRELGVGLSLDDFGTGYTSIEQFRTLPLHTLKIDRSFLAATGPGEGASNEALVGLLVHCAHTFGLTVIAEGVEHREQVELLRSLGCDSAQGYLFSRPVPAAEVAGLFTVRR
jgi:diguanylate cyclase